MAQTKIDYISDIIEEFDLEDLGLSSLDTHNVRDRLQLRLQKLPNMTLAQVLQELKAPDVAAASEITKTVRKKNTK